MGIRVGSAVAPDLLADIGGTAHGEFSGDPGQADRRRFPNGTGEGDFPRIASGELRQIGLGQAGGAQTVGEEASGRLFTVGSLLLRAPRVPMRGLSENALAHST